MTILVGDATDKPSCTIAITPQSMNVHDTAVAQVTCQPAATSFTWDASPAFGPTPPASPTDAGNLVFDVAGTFPYAVSGTNAAGTGAKAAAQVYVQSNLQYRTIGYKSGGGVFTFPAGVQSTDLLVMYVLSPNATPVATPAGWTLSTNFAWSAYAYQIYLFSKIAGADTSVTLPTSSSQAAWMYAFSGASGFAQIGTFVETTATATSCTKALPGTLTPGSLVISIASDRDSTYPSLPTNYTQRSQGIAGSLLRTTVSDRVYTGSATGNVTSGMAAGSSGICNLFEVKP